MRNMFGQTRRGHAEFAHKSGSSSAADEDAGEEDEDAAWFYPEPKAPAAEIRDHIAFWKGVTVEG